VIELLRAALDSGDPVLDSMLPGLNGMELASVIREDARFNALKLMVLATISKKRESAHSQSEPEWMATSSSLSACRT
jgi:CheY-like chemotaxis protein